MICLVTGATGFVGSAVARVLLGTGAEVRVLARPGGDRRNLTGLDVEVREGDLLVPQTLREAVRGCTALYHVAADYRLWTPDPAALYAANVEGTRALLLAAAEAGLTRIVYTSSVATLGYAAAGSADETTPVSEEDMIGDYKRSKFLAERAVDELVAERGLPVVTVNPSTPIGPRDIKPTPTGRMIVEAAAGRMPAFVDTGLNVAHVEDVAEGHLLAFERGRTGERYVLGGENLTLQSILGEVAEAVGARPPRVRLPHRLVLPLAHLAEAWYRLAPPRREPMLTVDSVRMSAHRMFFSSQKAVRELGYHPRPARAAIRDAVQWFRDNQYC